MDEIEKKLMIVIIASFFSSIILFLLGIHIGNLIVQSKAIDFYVDYRNLYVRILDLNLLMDFMLKNCSYINIDKLALKIYSFGKPIETMEKVLGYKNRDVLFLKELYNLLILKYYFKVYELSKKCNKNYVFILFFYSNDKKYLDNSVKMGDMLDYLIYYFKSKYNIRLIVAPLETKLIYLESVNYLMKQYNITNIPAIVINNKYVFYSFNTTFYIDFITKNILKK